MALTGASMLVLLGAGIARANDLKVCKASDPHSPVQVTGTFDFTRDSIESFSLTVGSCRTFSEVGEGLHTVTETPKAGFVVSVITITPSDPANSVDPAAGTATAHVGGGLTTITFFNTVEFAGICHNIGGPRELGANCDVGSQGDLKPTAQSRWRTGAL